ncbi:MAG: BatA domain-containing protein [Bacteroidia bacterium]|nr:BatA domain-containing protein [Bacteroidia bacterium]
MQFLYPSFFLSLGLLAIPVIIHLFNFRRYKKIVFSDIRFLKQLTEQNKKQQTIKKWLILFCRMLAITFLVVAFAQPYLPYNKNIVNYQNRIVSVYIDNSFTMQAVNKDGPLLDQAKTKAKEVAEIYGESDQFQLLTNDFEGRHQRLVNQKDFIQMIAEVVPTPVHRNLSEVYNRQQQLLGTDKGTQKSIYWFSDFQKQMADYQQIKSDSTINIRIVPLNSQLTQNIWIDSVWLKEPFIKTGSATILQILIKNQSETLIENQPLVLKIDGVEKGIQNYSCNARDKIVIGMSVTLNDFNWHQAELSLTDYPLVFDDVFYLALKSQQNIQVLLLNQNTDEKAFEQVYALDPFYKLNTQRFQHINYAIFQQSSLLILNEPDAISSGLRQELNKFMANGGVVLFIPSAAPKDLAGINTFLSEAGGVQLMQLHKQNLKVASIDIQDALFEKVFTKIPEQANLPVLNESWQIHLKGTAQAKPIMLLNNDWPYLIHSRYKKGSLFVTSASFNKISSNLMQHALFVPFLLRMPLLAKTAYPLSYVLGEQTKFNFDNPSNQKLVKLKLTKQEYLLETFTRDGKWEAHLNGQIKTAGVYNLKDQQTEIARIAFNYNRKESFPQTANIGELTKALGATEMERDLSFLKKKINLEENGIPYWRLALFLALAFVLIELLLLRLIK